jgi:hypothetical protein
MAKPIETYLNDHLGGAAGGLALIETLSGQGHTAEFERDVESVRNEIEADRESLRRVMETLRVTQGVVKQAGAHVAAKAVSAKTSTILTRDEDFSRLLALEALCIGIAGKKAAWLALQAAPHPALADVDFDRLITRADEQRARLEPHRLEAAAAAFAS